MTKLPTKNSRKVTSIDIMKREDKVVFSISAIFIVIIVTIFIVMIMIIAIVIIFIEIMMSMSEQVKWDPKLWRVCSHVLATHTIINIISVTISYVINVTFDHHQCHQ